MSVGADQNDGPGRRTGKDPSGRRIGTHRGGRPGPLLVAVGGLHGNEPAGVVALRRVLGELEVGEGPDVRGTFVALAGNVGALEESVRYRKRDLNRQWTPPRTDRVRGRAAERPGLGPEGREQRSLLRILEGTLERDRRGPAYLVDLHTTSGESPPFGIAGRREACRRFAAKFPMPMVLGLERHLPGMLSEWACRRGFASLTVEAGQHEASASVDRHRAALWIALAAAGLLEGEHPLLDRASRLLSEASEGVPRRVAVRYRHGIEPDDGFRMKSGWKNFDVVREGDPLAEDRRGDIVAPHPGLLFLPLYQELGSDGFFLVRATGPEADDTDPQEKGRQG